MIIVYSSSSSPPPPDPFLAFFLLTRPARPPPKGDFKLKSMCFWLSKRTTKEGTFTTCLRTNVSLANKNARMMNGLGQSKLEDLGLQTSFQEILDFEAQNVIQLHSVFVKDSNTDQTTQECVTLEETTGILVLQGEQVTSSFADLGQSVLDPPDLTLVFQSIFANEFQFLIQTRFLEWTTGSRENLGSVTLDPIIHHLGPLSSTVWSNSNSPLSLTSYRFESLG